MINWLPLRDIGMKCSRFNNTSSQRIKRLKNRQLEFRRAWVWQLTWRDSPSRSMGSTLSFCSRKFKRLWTDHQSQPIPRRMSWRRRKKENKRTSRRSRKWLITLQDSMETILWISVSFQLRTLSSRKQLVWSRMPKDLQRWLMFHPVRTWIPLLQQWAQGIVTRIKTVYTSWNQILLMSTSLTSRDVDSVRRKSSGTRIAVVCCQESSHLSRRVMPTSMWLEVSAHQLAMIIKS